MTRYRLASTNLYERDFAAVLAWSEERFGRVAASRYRELVRAGGRAVATDPYQPAARSCGPNLAECRSLHLRHVQGQVKRPRHILYYTVDETRQLVTLRRLLHESMDVDSRRSTLLPETN